MATKYGTTVATANAMVTSGTAVFSAGAVMLSALLSALYLDGEKNSTRIHVFLNFSLASTGIRIGLTVHRWSTDFLFFRSFSK